MVDVINFREKNTIKPVFVRRVGKMSKNSHVVLSDKTVNIDRKINID